VHAVPVHTHRPRARSDAAPRRRLGHTAAAAGGEGGARRGEQPAGRFSGVAASLLLGAERVPDGRGEQPHAELLEPSAHAQLLERAAQQARPGGADDVDVALCGGALGGARHEEAKDGLPDGVAGLGREDGVGEAEGGVRSGLVREGGAGPGEYGAEGARALVVEVEVDTSVAVDDEVARRVRALDVRRVPTRGRRGEDASGAAGRLRRREAACTRHSGQGTRGTRRRSARAKSCPSTSSAATPG